jgi:hypothetical protein
MAQDHSIKFSKNFKKYEESKTYDEFANESVEFDSTELTLDSFTDIYVIMNEINKISEKTFKYGVLCDSQNRVVQQLEDEFERWKATIYYQHGIDDKVYKTEKSKERFLIVNHAEVYRSYQDKISAEKYKLSLLQRVVKSLESYAYKLHDMKEYNFAIEHRS